MTRCACATGRRPRKIRGRDDPFSLYRSRVSASGKDPEARPVARRVLFAARRSFARTHAGRSAPEPSRRRSLLRRKLHPPRNARRRVARVGVFARCPLAASCSKEPTVGRKICASARCVSCPWDGGTPMLPIRPGPALPLWIASFRAPAGGRAPHETGRLELARGRDLE